MPKSVLALLFVFVVLAVVSIVLTFGLVPKSALRTFPDCRVGGCSGELCLASSDSNQASICIYKEEWACYDSAVCEIQFDGRCGWTQTSELQNCLAKMR